MEMTADEDLLVFGYASRIYPQDDRSEFIAEERHLIESPNDPSLRLDRCVVKSSKNATLVVTDTKIPRGPFSGFQV
ncbi:unnamed protein product [Strongylus vulgaris]|uniref:Uncharacterized protein n=1 Tax=Strongylus vulgaris TaxID=40348 RepID=A0A3P7LW21_STRVU|nr:unnamed protein product [Strongylus vulgaris]